MVPLTLLGTKWNDDNDYGGSGCGGDGGDAAEANADNNDDDDNLLYSRLLLLSDLYDNCELTLEVNVRYFHFGVTFKLVVLIPISWFYERFASPFNSYFYIYIWVHHPSPQIFDSNSS